MRLFGPLHVSVAGHVVEIARPQERLLLVRLAVSAGDVVSVDVLADALWGARPPASARKVIQKYVADLRRLLGSDSLRTVTNGYVFERTALDVDILRFEQLLASARAARSVGRTRAAAAGYDEAFEVWRAAPMSALPASEFVEQEVQRLEAVRLQGIEERMEVGLELGQHDQLVSTLEDLVRRYPLRERLWAGLMTALYRSGRQADALAAYRQLDAVLGEQLGVAPAPELTQLERRILVQDPGLHGLPVLPRGNLPVGFTSFVGREDEVGDVSCLLGANRLVTPTGSGGSGKTRLAVETARSVAESYPDGVWFADLTQVSHPEHVFPMVVDVLGVQSGAGSPATELVELLADRRLLLVVDNCEHVLAGVTTLAGTVLAGTPSATLLCTSREPLGMTGEVIFAVDPLPLPGAAEARAVVTHNAAVRLFADRASAADRDFRLAAVLEVVSDICRRLDGLPLAIELAARQLHVLGPAELNRALTDHPELLTAPGEVDARHRTMAAAIGWSHTMLDPAQRSMLETVSVFSGSFTWQAAAYVAHRVGVTGAAVPLLTQLVSRSMVVRESGPGPARYRLLEPIRSFVLQQVDRRGGSADLARAHAEWVLALLQESANMAGDTEVTVLRQFKVERHQVLAALDWSTRNAPELGLTLVEAAGEFFDRQWRFEGLEEMTRRIDAMSDAPIERRAGALATVAVSLSESFRDYRSAKGWAERALELATLAGARQVAARAELGLAFALRSIDLPAARAALDHSMQVFEDEGDHVWAARALHREAQIALGQGEYDVAIAACDRAAEHWQATGRRMGLGISLWTRSAALTQKGEFDEAQRAAAQALDVLADFDNPDDLAHVSTARGDAARLAGRFEEAEPIYRACLRVFIEIGDRRCTASTMKNLGLVAVHRGRPLEAGHLLLAAHERRRALEDEAGIPECLEGLALVAAQLDQPMLAHALLACAEPLRDRTGTRPPTPELLELNDLSAAVRARVPPEELASMDRREVNVDALLHDLTHTLRDAQAAPVATGTPTRLPYSVHDPS